MAEAWEELLKDSDELLELYQVRHLKSGSHRIRNPTLPCESSWLDFVSQSDDSLEWFLEAPRC